MDYREPHECRPRGRCFGMAVNKEWHTPTDRLVFTWPNATGAYAANGFNRHWLGINGIFGTPVGPHMPIGWKNAAVGPSEWILDSQLFRIDIGEEWDATHLQVLMNNFSTPTVFSRNSTRLLIWDWRERPITLQLDIHNPFWGNPGLCLVYTVDWWKNPQDEFPDLIYP